MTETAIPAATPARVRHPRETLIKDRRPAGSIWLRKRTYNQRYQNKQAASGTPSRREVAETFMQVLFEEIEDPLVLDPATSKRLLESATKLLLSITTKGKDGTSVLRFSKAGIKRRIETLALEFMPAKGGQDQKPR